MFLSSAKMASNSGCPMLSQLMVGFEVALSKKFLRVSRFNNSTDRFCFVGVTIVKCLAYFEPDVVAKIRGPVFRILPLKQPVTEVSSIHLLPELVPQRPFVVVAIFVLDRVNNASG